MSILVQHLKKNNRIEKLNLTVCIVGSRKLSTQDDFWRQFAPNITIYGFDADEDACEMANAELESQETNWVEKHFPLALSKSVDELPLYVTKGVHCSSLYPPNEKYVSRFAGMRDGIKLDFSIEIETTTLDNFCKDTETNEIDFIQLDVQGADLDVLKGATEILTKSVLGVKVETGFSPLYQNAPLFSDIDIYLRDRNFLLFDLITDDNWCYRPRYISPLYSKQKKGQLIWADTLYFRDPIIENADSITQNPKNILKLACIADLFGYIDYSFELLEYLTINYGDDPQYNFAQEIVDILSQFPDVSKTLPDLPIVKNISHRLSPLTLSLIETRLLNYQNQFVQNKETPYLDYPSHVHLETMAVCNASCNFCPYPMLERKGEKMPDELIDKIIKDLQEIPRDIPFQLSPFKVNEPFLDRRLFDILKKINTELPNAQLTITSNSSPLNRKKLEQLSEIKNINYLWISFNDHREKEYEETMSLNYKHTIERLQMIHEYKSKGNLPFRVVLSRVGDRTQIDQEFRNWVGEHFPLFEKSVTPRGNWLGQRETPVGSVPNVGCNRWYELSITSTGVVAHCCMDGQAEWSIGDITKQSVIEVYNSPAYRKLREDKLTRLDVEPCKKCTFV